jgi:hypothetical protein
VPKVISEYTVFLRVTQPSVNTSSFSLAARCELCINDVLGKRSINVYVDGRRRQQCNRLRAVHKTVLGLAAKHSAKQDKEYEKEINLCRSNLTNKLLSINNLGIALG